MEEEPITQFGRMCAKLGIQVIAASSPQAKVVVCEGRHGQMGIEYRGQALRWREIAAPARPRPADESECQRKGLPVVRRKWVPPADHPWREAARRTAERKARKALERAGVTAAALARPSASP